MSTRPALNANFDPAEAARASGSGRACSLALARISPALLRWVDLLAPVVLVAAALPMRLANIGSYTGKGDEGIRAEQLLLMAAGFRPVTEVFASQGPLSLEVFYPFYLLLGQTLAGARLAVVIWSTLAILAVYWTARITGGRVGGWLAAALLIASPTFLKNSRLALVEIPAILPAIVALGAALAYQRSGQRRWLVGSAVALALALAIKPMIVAVVPAVGLALLLRWLPSPSSYPSPPAPLSPTNTGPLDIHEHGAPPFGPPRVKGRGGTSGSPATSSTEELLADCVGLPSPLEGEGVGVRGSSPLRLLATDLLLYGLACGGILAVIVLWVGPTALYDQLIRYRVGSREAEGWSLAENWDMLWGELQWDQSAFFGLAALSGLILLALRPRVGVPVVTWAALSFGLLLGYSPLGIKHAALQIPPTALLAGVGLGVLWQSLAAIRRPGVPNFSPLRRSLLWGAAGASGLALIAYLVAAPTVIARDRQAMTVGDLGSDPPYRQESQLIQALTGPDDFILVDDPYLAFLNGRKMPPWLVDTSYFRIRSGALSGADVVEHAEGFDVRLMLLLSDNLRQLKKFADWADEQFVVAKIDERSNRKDRALYLPANADLDSARVAVRAAVPGTVDVDGVLAGQVRVRSYALEQDSVRAGGTINLTVEWESLGPIPLDWRQVTFLKDASGKIVDQTERSLGGGSGGTSTWAPGRWVFRSSGVPIPPRTPAGEYTLGVGLYDSKARKMATVTAGPGTSGEEVRLGTLRVR